MESICKRLTKESHGEQTWTFWSKKDSVKSKSDEGGRNRYAHKCVICKGPGAAAAQLQMGNATYVVVAIATLRDGPSTKAKKVGELHVGAQVTAIAALEMDGHQRIQISATPPQWASTVVNTGKALMELVPTQQESVQQESVVNPVHESNGMQTVQMTCPAGCGPGSSIQAEINGTMMSLTVPEGVTGGHTPSSALERRATGFITVGRQQLACTADATSTLGAVRWLSNSAPRWPPPRP